MFADKRFLGLFEDLHRAGRPCVLASVVRTEGSSYRKAGAAMLIDPGYGFQGLISGGCFEADLEHYAREVFAERRARWVTYDLRGEDEIVWGLGLGCNGLIELWLQPFFAEDGYGALGAAHALAGAPIPYVGVLGPKQRTTQLLDEIGSGAEAAFAGRLYNPVGLDLGGDSPEAIALAVAAEILAVRSRARPAFMRDKDAPIHPVPGS